MELLYQDQDILVCIKPPRVLSTDEPGGLPDLIRQELGDLTADIRTVHRLDRVVSGLMVLARNSASALNYPGKFVKINLKKNILPLFTVDPKTNRVLCETFWSVIRQEK